MQAIDVRDGDTRKLVLADAFQATDIHAVHPADGRVVADAECADPATSNLTAPQWQLP